MPDIRLTNAGVPAPLTETQIIGAGPPVPSPTLVQTDRSTILGDGSHERPLHASSGIPGSIIVEDEGVSVAGAPHLGLNFAGDGVVATDGGGGIATVTIPGVEFEDEGVPVAGAPHAVLNFVGDGVTVTDAGGGIATVTIPGADAGQTCVLMWGLGLFTSTPAFVSPGGTSNDTSASNSFGFAVPFSGIIRNLYGRHNEAAGSLGDHATYTIGVNGTPTALSVNVPTGVIAQASNLSDTVAVNAGDVITLTVASVSIGPNVVQAKITAQFGP